VGKTNREIVERLFEAFDQRDSETSFRYLADEVEWHMAATQMPGFRDVYVGHDGIREFWREWLAAWKSIDWTMLKLEDLDERRVRVVVKQRNQGRESGIWVDQRVWEQVLTFGDGKVRRIDFAWVDG
jgi:ketosteroid isomerase-like protein